MKLPDRSNRPITYAVSDPDLLMMVHHVKGGVHSVHLIRDCYYDEGFQLYNDLKKSPYFIMDRPPRKLKTSLFVDFTKSKHGYNGISIHLRLSKLPVGYALAHSKDIVVTEMDDEPTCSIIIKLNAKTFSGILDYVTPAASGCVDALVDRFNQLCASISPILGKITDYRVRRTDACSNIVLHDLLEVVLADKRNGRMLTPLDVIRLIRMGDIPKWYKQHKCENERSMWLRNKSCIVNIYCKSEEMKDWKNGSLIGIEYAADIVRVEVQLLANSVNRLYSDIGRDVPAAIDRMFSEEWNIDVVCRYWKRVVGWGDWYRMSEAVKLIRAHGWHKNKQLRLIRILERIAEFGSVALAKQGLTGMDRMQFVNGLSDLREIGVNGVTIPDKWGLTWVPNVLECWLKQNGYERFIDMDDGPE